LKIVQFLVIKANVNPNVTDRWGNTPVDEARKGGFAEIVTYLQYAIFVVCMNQSLMVGVS